MAWIDINKKHPKFHTDRVVLVYMPKAYIQFDVQVVYNDGKGNSRFAKGWNKGEEFEVTHWKKLKVPNAPKK